MCSCADEKEEEEEQDNMSHHRHLFLKWEGHNSKIIQCYWEKEVLLSSLHLQLHSFR